MKTFQILLPVLTVFFIMGSSCNPVVVQNEKSMSSDRKICPETNTQASASIRTGTTREVLEKEYCRVGGLKSIDDNTEEYCSLKNRHIRLDVEYQYVKKGYINDKDKIVKISAPYFDPSNPPGS